MKVNTLTLNSDGYPESLRQVSSPPNPLYWCGIPWVQIADRPKVTIVGTRKITAYGKKVTEELATKLARVGVVIISGLAFGVDFFAHRATLETGGCTIAVLPSSINKVAPASHHFLAERILASGGALVSEFSAESTVHRRNFVIRNRVMSALADVVVIPEATKKSGSLHTARFALEQGKTVMAVPGNIDALASEGCNNLIKSGAVPVTSVNDVFFALGIEPEENEKVRIFRGTVQQQRLFELIASGIRTQEELVLASQLSGPQFSTTLTELELQGYIRPLGAGNWTIT